MRGAKGVSPRLLLSLGLAYRGNLESGDGRVRSSLQGKVGTAAYMGERKRS